MGDFVKTMEKKEKKRLKVLERLFERGVEFLSLDGVLIDDTVEVGKGTVIYPGVVLKGGTVIGENCTLTSGTHIEDCIVGDETVINASQCYRSKIGDEVKIGPFSLFREMLSADL